MLFLLGATVLHAGLTDLHLRYVKSGLRPLLLLAGAVLIVTAAATLRYGRPGRRADAPAATDPAPEHGEPHDREPPDREHGDQGSRDPEPRSSGGGGHREPRVSWLLALPLFALILVAPPALGSYTAAHTGTALQKPFGFPDVPDARGPLRLGVGEYAARAVYDEGRHLRDRPLRITGFVTLGRDGAPYLVRMTLNCCAADAQPVKIALTGNVPPVLRPDSWLEITGTYTPRRTKDPVNDGPVPYVKVTASRPVPPPSEPYDDAWTG
ncbi:TIGR03943 family protein [Streptomyces sp. H28]|uniref:TIGR03943 family putative permease subunit n=1 Tax=Streptomyces sp. H28 TaxID=2775865 RepID=UPI001781BD97|nr:TIGR03943 family protein [Streptomyces sp. H28]MBD9735005.1 TIGR03943 family protein [Streptomyces sp. H28]